MKQCCRCGARLEEKKKLRCPTCLEEVHRELTGLQNKPYQYYFKYHLKQQGKLKNTI